MMAAVTARCWYILCNSQSRDINHCPWNSWVTTRKDTIGGTYLRIIFLSVMLARSIEVSATWSLEGVRDSLGLKNGKENHTVSRAFSICSRWVLKLINISAP
jgi:hypothetical protein